MIVPVTIDKLFLQVLSRTNLEIFLKNQVEQENFEFAVLARDEIKRRDDIQKQLDAIMINARRHR